MKDDLILVQEYLSGKEDAVEELVGRYQKQVFALLFRIVNDLEEAKDLTQKVFLNAFRGLKDFRKESSFKTWIFRIAMNTGINHTKQNSRETIELREEIAGTAKGVLSEMIDQERSSLIRKYLDKLPGRQKTAIMLRTFEGLSCVETARVMNCSEGAVKAHFHNGVVKLRALLRERGYEIIGA